MFYILVWSCALRQLVVKNPDVPRTSTSTYVLPHRHCFNPHGQTTGALVYSRHKYLRHRWQERKLLHATYATRCWNQTAIILLVRIEISLLREEYYSQHCAHIEAPLCGWVTVLPVAVCLVGHNYLQLYWECDDAGFSKLTSTPITKVHILHHARVAVVQYRPTYQSMRRVVFEAAWMAAEQTVSCWSNNM